MSYSRSIYNLRVQTLLHWKNCIDAMMSTKQQKACMHVFVVAEWHRHNFLFNLREFIKSTFQICFPDINCHHTSKQKYVCLKICFCLPMKWLVYWIVTFLWTIFYPKFKKKFRNNTKPWAKILFQVHPILRQLFYTSLI